MHKLTATFRIVTPMFISGADQSKAELRAPSIKGALRFWWRALNWAKIRGTCDSDEPALAKLKEREDSLFGDADKHGQSTLLISISSRKPFRAQHPPFLHTDMKPRNNPNSMAGARYLGYGLITPFSSRNTGKEAGQLERACINPDQTFSVLLSTRQCLDDSILDGLKILGLLGGIGSRSRRGFGSLLLETIEEEDKQGKTKTIWETPDTSENYIAEIKNLMEKYNCASLADTPPFSAFYSGSRVETLLEGTSPYIVLNQLGLAMLDYRSWGQSSRGNKLPSGKTSEKRFENDHDWYKSNYRKSEFPGFHPRRVVFGLPHNYHKLEKHHVTPEKHERRGSPLFFHIHQFGSIYIGVAIFLKSTFLPNDEKINAGGTFVTQDIDWNVITNFLDGKTGNPPTNNDRFPHREVIFP